MELGKYKLAMRPKKYLTREFVVYKEAPEAMDDVITEEQNTIDTMPSQAPVIDNYMPEMQGMEDPSLRQVELADGGVVQREGFSQGSEPVFASEKKIESFKKEMKKKYPGLSVSEGLTSGGKRQIRIRYTKKKGKEDKVLFDKARHLMPTKENLKILREDAASFVKEAKKKGFEKISDPFELRAKQGLEKTKDQQKLFNDILEKVKQGKNFKYDTLAEKEIYRKLSTNIYKHNSEVGRNLGKGVPFLRNI
jgi:Fe-S cluster assembly iron-binding protein IscA